MRVTIHQPNYLPWRGFIEKARMVDTLVLLDTVQFTKGGYTNRTRMRSTAPCGWSWMTVPVRQRLGQPIRGVEIVDDGWRSKHFAWMRQAYKRSPYWEPLEQVFATVYEKPWRWLVEVNTVLIRVLLDTYGVRCRIVPASTLDARGEGSDYLLAICQEVGATTYFSGESGPNYLDRRGFAAAGIEARISAWTPDHNPPLSAVDALFMEDGW